MTYAANFSHKSTMSLLFFLGKDSMTLYQLIIISAAAMVYFRPRKEELLNLAKEMGHNAMSSE